MHNPVPLEYVSSFAQANQALMLHLASELLSESGRGADFQRFAELAQVQQDYIQQMGALWLSTMKGYADNGEPIGQPGEQTSYYHWPGTWPDVLFPARHDGLSRRQSRRIAGGPVAA
jgi:hypothetical protein